MNSSPAHTQPAVPAADSVSGTPDAPAWTGYVPGPDTLRAETDFAGTNFANPAFAETAFADGCSAPFSVAATGAAPSEWRDTTSAAIFGAQSTLAEPARIPLAPPPPLAENALFQSFVLLLAATYAMLLYRNLGDVRTLLGVFRTLIVYGATVIVIELDLDVIRSADYLIDMGPGGGEEGGRVVACGTPAEVKRNPESRTGKFI